jgi:pSer/pThr/pTyr-binding forkhead associated (FHA) protein
MKVIIEDDEGRRTIVPFIGEALTIGRDEGNNVRLTEKNVSRKHGRVVRQEGDRKSVV